MSDELRPDNHSDETAPDDRAGHPTRRRLRPGEKLSNRFVIVQFLAQGGMGEVYEAADLHLQGKHCALKTLRSELAKNSALRLRFEREVLLAREVNHRNVCPTYDLFHDNRPDGPITFLTMKLLRGESLLSRLHKLGRMKLEEILPIAKQMATALDAAHAVGVVHRDFKPGNVMIEAGPSGEVRVSITDFGLSRAHEAETTIADTGQILGTPGYIAPELIEGRVAGFAADVYAFGVVLYEMITGSKPVHEAGKAAFVPPSSVVPGLPPLWDQVVMGCLEFDPSKRLQSAGDALALLDAPRIETPPSSPRRSIRMRWKWPAAAVVAAAIMLALWSAAPYVASWLHPLPAKKFVALMSWPVDSDASGRPFLKVVLDTIGSRLARAETGRKDLLIISPGDVSGTTVLRDPIDAIGTLGANLVLAASIHKGDDIILLDLAILDAATSKQLRKTQLRVTTNDLSRLPDRAAVSAAHLLDVDVSGLQWKDQDDVAAVSPEVYRQFTDAEELVSKPNDTGLDQAIENYQKALESDPRFGLAYARLSIAYSRKFQISRDRAALSLAERNADLALRYHPASAKSELSRAIVDMYSGKTQEAVAALNKAIMLEPGNPQVLWFKAQALRNLDRPADEEVAYRQIISERPNYWPAYNELGFTFYRMGKYQEAANAFAEGSAVAPRVATLFANQGTMFLLLNKKKEAEDVFHQSLQLAPSPLAYSSLGALAFQAGDYRKALAYYEKERDLRPKNDVAWRNIADCYAMIGDSGRMIESYSKARDLISEVLSTNPTRGSSWVSLAFYEAKLGHTAEAETALRNAEARGIIELQSQFKRVQVLALLGRKEEAMRLLLDCLDKGLSQTDVELALDLKGLIKDPRYLQRKTETERSVRR